MTLPPRLLEPLLEELRDGAGVVGVAVAQQEGGLGAQVLHGEFRRHIGLVVVAERHHVGVFADLLRQVGHGAADIEIGNAGILGDRRAGQVEAGIGDADDGRHLVLVDQALRRVGDVGQRALAVILDQLDLLALHAAGSVDLLDRKLGALQRGILDRRVGAGQAEDRAELERIRRARDVSATASRRRPPSWRPGMYAFAWLRLLLVPGGLSQTSAPAPPRRTEPLPSPRPRQAEHGPPRELLGAGKPFGLHQHDADQDQRRNDLRQSVERRQLDTRERFRRARTG